MNTRTDLRLAGALFVGFLALYLFTLCPTVYFGDSGEITGAITLGGIIHPPGYPLFALLGRAALFLVPFGEPTFRIGVIVALAAAGCVSVLFLVLRQLSLNTVAAIAGATTLGLSRLFWTQSNRVEVYSLHLLIGISAILFALRWRETGKLRELQLACLIIGLGLAHHLTIVLWIPGLLILAGKRVWTDPNLGRRLLLCLPLFFIGPLLYLCLPLWARDESGHNWGDPSNAENLWNHVSARLYRGNVKLPVSSTDFSHAVDGGKTALLSALPLWLWPAALFGGWSLWQLNRAAATGLGLIALVVSVYSFCYSIPDISPYYLPVLVVASCLLAAALNQLPQTQRSTPLITMAAPLALALLNFGACNLHSATFVREFARQKLESCSPNGVLLTEGDQDWFPVSYVSEVLKVRPDVLPIVRGMVSMNFTYTWDNTRWYLRTLRAKGVTQELPVMTTLSLQERRRLAKDGYLISLFEGPLRDRPLHLTFLQTSAESTRSTMGLDVLQKWMNTGYTMAPQGLVIAFHSKSAAPTPRQLAETGQAIWDKLPLPNLSEIDMSQEMDPTYLRQHYITMLSNQGYLWELAGQPTNAAQIYQALLDWDPSARSNLEKLTKLSANVVKQ
ncbi:MAG: DUF2723 domain-containing protein [Armatimonas sp.]